MITTVIFDLGEVYLKCLKGTEHKLQPALNMPPEHIHSQFHTDDLKAFFHGEMTEEDYWGALIAKHAWPFTVAQLKGFLRENIKEIEGTREIIEQLKHKGYKIGLLSIHAKEWVEYCNHKYNYHPLFHSILYSFEVGISKPDKRVYELILKKLNSKADECVFIDDQQRNLIPARELGIHTIHFKDSGQLRGELQRLSLL